jgi:hypothetical protein
MFAASGLDTLDIVMGVPLRGRLAASTYDDILSRLQGVQSRFFRKRSP